MKLVVLGSGGSMPTPRPFCTCGICDLARKKGEPYKRNSSSLFIKDESILVDCPEDICDSLNRRNIPSVSSLLITHWHPDHAFGLRPLLESYYEYGRERMPPKIRVFLPQQVYDDLQKVYPGINYLINIKKVASLEIISPDAQFVIGTVSVTPISYGKCNPSTFAYKFSKNGKTVLYSPCDTISFERELASPDVLITECGMFAGKVPTEILFTSVLERIRKIRPKKAFLTHIEERDLKELGWDHLEKSKLENEDINFEFAYDGLEIETEE